MNAFSNHPSLGKRYAVLGIFAMLVWMTA